MRATIQTKTVSNKKWIIPLVLFIISIVVEISAGDYLFYYSYDSIRGVQNFLNNSIGFSIFDNSYELKDKENNTNLINFENNESTNKDKNIEENIEEFVKEVDGKIIFSEVFHFFNTNTFFIMISAITYNFVNIYKIFVLTYSIFLANFISSTLGFIFHSPRPYMYYFSIKPVIMFNEWGSPNNQIVVLISFSLSFYEVIVRTRRLTNSIIGKIITIIIIGLIDFIDIFLMFASGNIGFNQIIFSILIGVVTHQIIFSLFKVEVNNSKQLFNFLKFKKRYYFVINAILIAFQYILNIFIIDDLDEDYFTANIKEQQKRLFYSEFLYKHFNYRSHFYLNKGNFCNVICFSMNIIAFIALNLELFWTYKGDYENWSSNNFERPANALLDVSQQDDYVIRDATQWNHTGSLKTMIRFFLIIFLCLCSMVPSVLIYSLIDSNDWNGYLFIIGIPMILLVFGMFYFYKIIFRCFKLTKKR
jgi:hypothetical protein